MLPLTPGHLAAVYDMLRAFPPFCRWNLPPAATIKFRVLKTKAFQAQWWIEGDRHHIDVSKAAHVRLETVVATMAHEMIHVRQRMHKTETKAEHNANFHRQAKRVCDLLGFDLGQFNG